MAGDRPDLFSFVQSAGKVASDLFDKTKEAARTFIDEHDLKEIDVDDVAETADKALKKVEKTASSVYEGVKAGSAQISKKVAQAKREADLRKLQPVFAEDLTTPDFTMSKLVRLTRMDRRRAASEVCRGSIGHDSSPGDVRIVNLYTDHLDRFGLKFCPDADSEFYYVDPTDRSRYIALDDYFDTMKSARIAELQKLAQDLGARHFRVIYTEEKRALTRRWEEIRAIPKGKGSASAYIDCLVPSSLDSEIVLEMDLSSHPPVRPTLAYLRKEPAIRELVELRFSLTPVTHQRLVLHLSDSSGMKEKEAARIDAALGAMNCAGNTSVVSEAQNESRRYLEYEIDF